MAFSAVGNLFSSMHSVELTLIEGIHFRSNLKIAQNNGSVKWTMIRVTCFGDYLLVVNKHLHMELFVS